MGFVSFHLDIERSLEAAPQRRNQLETAGDQEVSLGDVLGMSDSSGVYYCFRHQKIVSAA